MGGGQGVAVTLTADLVARAVIAAACSYGDDPVRAMTAQRGIGRRCVTPAAVGVARATGCSVAQVSRCLGIRKQNAARSNHQGGEAYAAAVLAATRAVECALWRPAAVDDDEPECVERVEEEATAQEPEPLVPEVEAPSASAPAAPAQPPRPAVAHSSGPLRDLILKALAERPLNTMSLAYLVDSKEMAVSSTLVQLEHEGLVQYRTVENGPRRFEWLLKAAA